MVQSHHRRREAADIARPVKHRCICSLPKHTRFVPEGVCPGETVRMGLDEYETVRLMDFVHLSQAECAERMGVSRATVARLYEHARQIMAEALVEGKRLTVEGGNVTVCLKMKPECIDEPYCCHRQNPTSNIGGEDK